MSNNQITKKEIFDWMRVGQGFSSQEISPRRIKWSRSFIEIFRRFFSGIALVNLPLALAAAGMAGRYSGRLSVFGPSTDEIRAFLGDVPKLDHAGISREIAASAAKNMVLRSFVGHAGLDGLAPYIRISGAEYLCHLNERRLPAILLFGHNGPIPGILAGLIRLKIPVLVFKDKGSVLYPIPPNIKYCFTEGGVKNRAVALKLAIDQLRSGGFVLLAIWGEGSSDKDAVDFMGRKTSFTPGFAMAARVSAAPVIPVFSRWAQGRQFIDLHFYDPLPWPDCPSDAGGIIDRSLINEAAQWLEAGIRSVPGQIQLNQLRSFLAGRG
jgi:lauroyl/myristoyl acyltransferase